MTTNVIRPVELKDPSDYVKETYEYAEEHLTKFKRIVILCETKDQEEGPLFEAFVGGNVTKRDLVYLIESMKLELMQSEIIES